LAAYDRIVWACARRHERREGSTAGSERAQLGELNHLSLVMLHRMSSPLTQNRAPSGPTSHEMGDSRVRLTDPFGVIYLGARTIESRSAVRPNANRPHRCPGGLANRCHRRSRTHNDAPEQRANGRKTRAQLPTHLLTAMARAVSAFGAVRMHADPSKNERPITPAERGSAPNPVVALWGRQLSRARRRHSWRAPLISEQPP
jgi:hypothetical protein